MRSNVLATILLAGGLMTGCAATVTADAYPPDMAYVSPGVQVIADYNEPIFFTDGFYWRFYGDTWYRSTYYTGGWVYARPPVAVLRIDRPYAYAHYRPVGYVARHPAQPVAGGWRGGGAPAPAASGWRGTPATAPPPGGGGWRGGPATAPPPGGGAWRGGPQPAAAHPAPVAGGWRGGPAAPPASHPTPAPAPARPAPKAHGGGWHH